MVHFIPSGQRRLAILAAQADTAPVLILGAEGTGKGAIARWIHNNSPRSTRSFLIATQDQSLASQILNAKNGSLVIPEISECSRSEQLLLLNYLKTKSIPHPQDENLQMLVNTRIMVTSSHALEGRSQAGLFNSELLQKLNVFRIEMPNLKERTEEFDDIVNGILGEITRELHKEHIKTLSPSVWNVFRLHEWAGNIRELRNVLRVAVIQTQNDFIDLEDIPNFSDEKIDFRATREEFEKTYIIELLKTFDWQIDKTCQMSRIDKDALLNKIKKYGIDVSQEASIR